MPGIVDYAQVLEQMQRQGLRSLYYNSGAFGFPEGAAVASAGWIGPEDPTLRPAARELVRPVAPPYEPHLTELVVRAWQHHLAGTVWLMPKSHWAYELDFGSRDWMPGLLARVGVDASLLRPRTNAAAIEFTLSEAKPFAHVVQGLLGSLFGSDFALAFPDRPIVCTLHHHKQVWWTSPDDGLIHLLLNMTPAPAQQARP